MKLTFSTENVKLASFLSLCRYADDYGFSGIEISDAEDERIRHSDSILRPEHVSEAKRKLYNRGLELAALTCPFDADGGDVTPELLKRYIDMAHSSGAGRVIIRACGADSDGEADSRLAEKLSKVCAAAEKKDVEILIETVGRFADTKRTVAFLNGCASAALGACSGCTQHLFRYA